MLRIKNKKYILVLFTKKALAVLILCLLFFLSPFYSSALSIAVRVPEKYTDIVAGERLYFELEIKYPENPSRKDLRLNYEIKKDGEIIAQAKFLKAIETQASFMDYVVIPEIAEKGIYDINVVVSDYENLYEEVSATFYVTSGKWSQLRIYFFILLGVVISVGVFIFWEIRILIGEKKKKKKKKNN